MEPLTQHLQVFPYISNPGPVAQGLEQSAHNGLAGGSIPPRPITRIDDLGSVFKTEPEEVAAYPHLMDKYVAEEVRHTTWLYTHAKETPHTGYHSEFHRIGNRAITWRSGRKHYYDTDFYFDLIVENAFPAACLGFSRDPEYRLGLIVRQIQGVPGMGASLKGIRWEKLLLHTLCEWAFKYSPIVRIRCIDAESDNYWPKLSDHQLEKQPLDSSVVKLLEKRERMKMHYDVSPKRLGFIRDGKTGKPLRQGDPPYVYSVMTRPRYIKKFG